MRNQIWYIAVLIGLMCIIRFSLSIFGYVMPHVFMSEIGIPSASNLQMPYAIRAWAIRDMVISGLVVLADRSRVRMLLIGCAVIDLIDIISAYLSGLEGLFDGADGWLLKLTSTAIATLALELIAIFLLSKSEAQTCKGGQE